VGAVVWVLPILVGLVLPLWADGAPVEASLSLVIAGLLLKARQAHAERPGVWFPLLVTGSTTFALTFSAGSAYFDLWRFLIGVAVAIGLGVWAWRARSYVVAATAVGYLAAVWHVQRLSTPVEEFGWFAYTPLAEAAPAFDFPPHPELVLVAGAVLAHTRVDRVRPWHVLAVVGLLGSLWHYGALVLVVAAAVVAGYDLNARRPGAWYPLLLVGIGLVVWPVVDWVTAPRWTDPVPDGYYATLTAVERTAAVSVSHVDYDELFLAFLVAVGLAAWSWRRKSPIMLLTAAVLLGVMWLRTGSVRPELVVLAGAAVAFATTAAPRDARTAGRWAGTPDRPPEP
jgi:hypothetical protein